MCGRFALTASPDDVAESLGLATLEGFPPRYNIAPTQPILVVAGTGRQEPGSNQPSRAALLARWGLIPSWVKDPKDFPLLLNARSETVNEKASFRGSMRHHRALIPASGFYEWHRPDKESGARPQAYWVRPRNGGVIAFAGLMQPWGGADGSELDTAAILTCAANPTFAPIHDRMPVVITPENYERWLDCTTGEPRDVADLLRAAPDDFFETVPVSDLVNKVKNTGPELQTPAENVKPPAPASTGQDNGQMSLF